MTILYNIKYKTNILHSRLTAEEASNKLQDYADKFYASEDDPNAWPFDPKDITMEEIINAS
tara:strand:+ start:950 stop:1132 length:183 start_codon:yes stop_codon:yes gene_type:complete